MRDHQWAENEKKRMGPDVSAINQKLDVFLQQIRETSQSQEASLLSGLKALLVERNIRANVAIFEADSIPSAIAASGSFAAVPVTFAQKRPPDWPKDATYT